MGDQPKKILSSFVPAGQEPAPARTAVRFKSFQPIEDEQTSAEPVFRRATPQDLLAEGIPAEVLRQSQFITEPVEARTDILSQPQAPSIGAPTEESEKGKRIADYLEHSPLFAGFLTAPGTMIREGTKTLKRAYDLPGVTDQERMERLLGYLSGTAKVGFGAASGAMPELAGFNEAAGIVSEISPKTVETLMAPVTTLTKPTSVGGQAAAELADLALQTGLAVGLPALYGRLSAARGRTALRTPPRTVEQPRAPVETPAPAANVDVPGMTPTPGLKDLPTLEELIPEKAPAPKPPVKKFEVRQEADPSSRSGSIYRVYDENGERVGIGSPEEGTALTMLHNQEGRNIEVVRKPLETPPAEGPGIMPSQEELRARLENPDLNEEAKALIRKNLEEQEPAAAPISVKTPVEDLFGLESERGVRLTDELEAEGQALTPQERKLLADGDPLAIGKYETRLKRVREYKQEAEKGGVDFAGVFTDAQGHDRPLYQVNWVVNGEHRGTSFTPKTGETLDQAVERKRVEFGIPENTQRVRMTPATPEAAPLNPEAEQAQLRGEGEPIEKRIVEQPIHTLPEPLQQSIQNEAKNLEAEVRGGEMQMVGTRILRGNEGEGWTTLSVRKGGQLNTFPEWFTNLGEDKQKVLNAIEKIKKDAGSDTGELVAKIKQVILDRKTFGDKVYEGPIPPDEQFLTMLEQIQEGREPVARPQEQQLESFTLTEAPPPKVSEAAPRTERTAEDYELHPGAMTNFPEIAIRYQGKTYKAKYGEEGIYNHADLIEKNGLMDVANDVEPGFLDQSGKFVNQGETKKPPSKISEATPEEVYAEAQRKAGNLEPTIDREQTARQQRAQELRTRQESELQTLVERHAQAQREYELQPTAGRKQALGIMNAKIADLRERLGKGTEDLFNTQENLFTGEPTGAAKEQTELAFAPPKQREFTPPNGEPIKYESAFSEDPAYTFRRRGTAERSSTRPLGPGEEQYARRFYSESKNFQFTAGKERIDSPDDVAYLFRQLESQSVEHTFFVHLNKSRRPIIQHHTSGIIGASLVDIGDVANLADRYGTEQILFVHNHPSGNLKPSTEDMAIFRQLQEALGDLITVHPGVIIDVNEGKYATFTGLGLEGVRSRPTSGEDIPIRTVYFNQLEYLKPVSLLDQVNSPDDVIKFVNKSQYSAGPKLQLLSLSANNRVMGKFLLTQPFEGGMMSARKLANEVNILVSRSAGRSAILMGNSRIQDAETKAFLRTLKLVLGQRNIELLDYIGVEPSNFVQQSAKSIGALEPNAPYTSRSNEPAPRWYSKLEKLIKEKLPNAFNIDMLKNLVSKGEVKADEVKWSGIDDFIKDNEGKKISKVDVEKFLDENNVKVEERVLGGKGEYPTYESLPKDVQSLVDRLNSGEIETDQFAEQLKAKGFNVEFEMSGDLASITKTGVEPTKYGNYVLPGGKNYRELLLTLPSRGMAPGFETFQAKDGGWGVRFPDGTELTGWRTRESAIASQRHQPGEPNFRGSHFDEPNVLAHIRFDERTDTQGKKTLFIEEIQSDWHQEGKRKGYKVGLPDEYELREVNGKYGIWSKRAETWSYQPLSSDKEAVLNSFNATESLGRVPDAPFKKTWHEVAFRRIVRWAAENGFDKVAWTTGDQQAARYDLSKQVDMIIYKKLPDGTFNVSAIKGGEGIPLGGKDAKLNESQLAEYVGKEIAQKIVNGDGRGLDLAPTNAPSNKWTQLSDLDLKVGGEGMKGFYDKILVDYANKFGKKFGAKSESTSISTTSPEITERAGMWVVKGPDGALLYQSGDKKLVEGYVAKHPEKFGTQDVHSLPITPDMKRSALQEGFPLFNVALGAMAGVEQDDEGNIRINPGRMILGTLGGMALAMAFGKYSGSLLRLRENKTLRTVFEPIIRKAADATVTMIKAGRLNREDAGNFARGKVESLLRDDPTFKRFSPEDQEAAITELAAMTGGLRKDVLTAVSHEVIPGMKEKVKQMEGELAAQGKTGFELELALKNRIKNELYNDPALKDLKTDTRERFADLLERYFKESTVLAKQKDLMGDVAGAEPYAEPQLKTAYKNLVRQSSKVIAEMGEGGKELTRRIHQQEDLERQYMGDASAVALMALKLSKKEYNNLTAIRAGMRFEKTVPEAMSDRVRAVNDALTEFYKKIGTEAEREGMEVFVPSEGEKRQFRMRKEYEPRMFAFDIDKLGVTRDKEGLARPNIKREQILESMVENGRAKNKAEASYILDEYLAKTRVMKSGNIENARELNLSENLYESDPIKVLIDYSSRAAKRLSEARIYGKDHEIASNLLDKIRQDGYDEQFARRAFRYEVGALTGDERAMLHRVNTIKGLQSLTKFSPFTSFRNSMQGFLGTTTRGNLKAGVIGLMKGYTEKARMEAAKSGALADQIQRLIDREVGGGTTLASKYLDIIGFTAGDRANKVISAAGGEVFYKDMLKRLQTNSPLKARAAREFTKMGLNADEVLKRGSFTEDELNLIRRTFAGEAQGSIRPSDLPLWWNSPEGKLITQWKPFGYKLTQLIRDNVWNELKAGNVAPLVTLITAYGATGEFVNYVIDRARGIAAGDFKGEQAAKRSAIRLMKEGKTDEFLLRVLNDYAGLGAISLAWDFIRSFGYGKSGATGAILGPTAGEAVQIAEDLFNPVGEALKGQTKHFGANLARGALRTTLRNIPGSGTARTFGATRKIEEKLTPPNKQKAGSFPALGQGKLGKSFRVLGE